MSRGLNGNERGGRMNDSEGPELNLAQKDSTVGLMQSLGLLPQRQSSEHRDIFASFPTTNLNLPRLESNGNIFSGFRPEEPIKQPPKLTPHQAYTLQCLEYEKYLYDNQIKLIIRRMAIRAYNLFRSQKNNIFFAFPLQKLLGIIAKKLLLNRFQLLFLEYAFEETKWKYDIDCIQKHADHFNTYVLIQDSEIPVKEIKYMQIYLLYCAYYSKKSLNQLPADHIFNDFFQSVCPKFKQYFPQWTQKSSVANRINPKMLNNIFKRLTFYSDRDKEQIENYALIVEEIIDISPSYNADKSAKGKKKETKKKKKGGKIEYEPANESGYLPVVHYEQQEDEVESIPALKQKKSSYLYNVDGLDPKFHFNQSLYPNE